MSTHIPYPIKVGIIGAGRIGQIHCKNLSTFQDVEIVGVIDSNLDAAQACADAHGISVASSNHQVLLKDTSLAAVVVCSPTDTHLGLIKEAAAAKKHVFCEKPLGFDIEKIDETLKAIRQAGVKLQVGFNRRFDPHFSKLREIVAAKGAGNIQIVRITSRDPSPPSIDYIERSGGIFLDMSIHDFDMLRFILNDTPEKLYSVGSVLIDKNIGTAGDIDTAVTTLRFSNGIIATVENCRQSSFGYDQRIEVIGDTGSVAVGNIFPATYVISDARGIHGPCPHYFFAERYEQSYRNEMKAFIDCIASDTSPCVTGEDARIATAIGIAARRSLRECCEVHLENLIKVTS